MSALTTLRQGLAADLRDLGYRVSDHVPASINPPLILISTGDPYIEDDDTLNRNEFIVNLELLLIAASGSNSREIEALEQMIEKVILNLGAWTLTGVSAPFEATVAGQNTYLTSRLAISNLFSPSQG